MVIVHHCQHGDFSRWVQPAEIAKVVRFLVSADSAPVSAYTRPQTEEQLLAALEEIGSDGGGESLADLNLDFGGEPGGNGGPTHEEIEAEEIPEVDSPLDSAE